VVLKVVIVDDEPAACRNLNTILTEYCSDAEVVGIAESVAEAIPIINKEQPDLLFLDIHMPHANGFQLLKIFPERTFDVVFLTAFKEHAIEAIRAQAFDYLLKPTDFTEVMEVVARYIKKRQPKTTSGPRKLALPVSNGVLLVAVDDIIMIKGDGNYCHFHLTDGQRVTVSKSMKHFKQNLPTDTFYRSHQSFLVNLKMVIGYQRPSIIQLKNNLEAELSRTNKHEFVKLLGL
jgi:two-component system LytT family response regulator